MAKTVLIAGGSGLIGTALSEHLQDKEFHVKLLGRKKKHGSEIETFEWDPLNAVIDQAAFTGTDFIINLAGANVGQGKWTNKRKEELISSRTLSTQLLVDSILKHQYPIKKFIQASAVGYYGFKDGDIEFYETDECGTDFLAKLTQKWELAMIPLSNSHYSTLLLRIGVVLSSKSGALVEMAKPIKMFVGSPLGSGKQTVPWIHIQDLIAIFMKGLTEPSFEGTFNAVAPEPGTNKELVRAIAKAIHRPVWPIGVPAFLLKLLLGEQAQIVLKGNKVSAKKIIKNNFHFTYSSLKEAVNNLLK